VSDVYDYCNSAEPNIGVITEHYIFLYWPAVHRINWTYNDMPSVIIVINIETKNWLRHKHNNQLRLDPTKMSRCLTILDRRQMLWRGDEMFK